ncbi:MmcQ/YjbR family DNA-binding protein [Fulvivirga sp. 29W222]|uniref:MmcQ/YjbR family DNA-binding protein n=1 Tax=Fulvivirga marina TaxID=2494733 RepID=A0A937G3L8_9BACT|nr:MmcQ/YjbR family DNA-binding protein [Fulvivirga marina]MBL6447821.1 MmcQ/YjbR family DNA-binding protein [Fulvivirga marina]
MNIEEYRNRCLAKPGVTESFPFPSIPDCLVFKVCGKMFTATDVNTFASISVKCDPEKVDELRATYPAVAEPSYMSKRHWNLIMMDGTIPDHLLFQWIDDSYQLVVAKLTAKARNSLV